MLRFPVLFLVCLFVMGGNALGVHLRGSDDSVRELNSLFEDELGEVAGSDSEEFFFEIEFRSKGCDIEVADDMETAMLAALRAGFMDLDVLLHDVSVGSEVQRHAIEGHLIDGHRELGGRYAYGDACKRCRSNRRVLADNPIDPLEDKEIEARMSKALWISVFKTLLEHDPCLKKDTEKSIKVQITPKVK